MNNRRLARRAAAVLGLSLVVSALPVVPAASSGPIIDFDPGFIISDAVMYDARSMTLQQIDEFIRNMGRNCVSGGGLTCLKDYRESTPTRPATSFCPGVYQGAANESAAEIIYKASNACGINPQVLLVKLQKEQGLITTARPPETFARALGFGCPDTTPGICNPAFAGFANQAYSAASRLQEYAARPASFNHRFGQWNNVLYHPNRDCGSSPVFIVNQATASLYNYTPYQPNAAALAAGAGVGDACSSYGNRNFHRFFRDWFGSPTGNRTPFGAVDFVQDLGTGQFRVGGWAADRDVASIDVHVYVDGRIAGGIAATQWRSDIERIHGRPHSGFSGVFSAALGARNVCVYAINQPAGFNPLIGCRTVTVTSSPPIGVIDSATSDAGGIRVRGWAFDPGTSASIDVHYFVDGQLVRGDTANGSRPDVGAAFARGSAHGFNTLVSAAPGQRQVCVFAISRTGTTNPQIGCHTVTVGGQAPIGSLDVVSAAGPGRVRAYGWAFSPETSAAIPVHIYVDGQVVLGTQANAARPDVGAAFGRGANHGFDVTFGVAPGARRVCVFAINPVAGVNPQVGCRDVTVG